MSFIFGGGGGGGGYRNTNFIVVQREAPGVEARKLALYDQAAKLAQLLFITRSTSCSTICIRTSWNTQAGQQVLDAGTVGPRYCCITRCTSCSKYIIFFKSLSILCY